MLTCAEILRRLPGHPWASLVQVADCVDSTNTRLKAAALAGAPEGTVLLARHQTGGRGRLGRQFLSPEGAGLYLSVLLRPGAEPGELMHLTCAVAVAVCRALEEACGLTAGIKWINDIVYDRRKLGGILTELGFDRQGRVDWAVVGIGLNCSQGGSDFDPAIRDMAGSIAMATGTAVDQNRLAAALIRHLEILSRQMLTHRAEYLNEYRPRCVTLGKVVKVCRGETVTQGCARDIDDQGALLVDFGDGIPKPVSAGEVSVRGMYGYV